MMGNAPAANTPIDRLYALIRNGLAMGDPASSLTTCEWCILLRVQDDVHPGEIAKTTKLSQPHVSRTLRKLEGRGLVERSLAPGDNRRTVVRVTTAGAERIAEAHRLALQYSKSARGRYLR